MKRIFSLIMAVALGAALMAPTTLSVVAKERGSLLELFFSNDKKKTNKAKVQKKPAVTKSTRKKVQQRPRVNSKKVVPDQRSGVAKAVEKSADANKLFVFGDSMAGKLAKGLALVYAEDPKLSVINASNGSSGIVRDDYYDWNAAITEYLAQGDVSIAVVSIGVNDRQALRVKGTEQKPLSDAWKVEYRARLAQFLQLFRDAKVPVIWVGLPPMRASGYSNAMSQISSLHRSAAFSGNAEFVDIFERFIDEDGKFSSYGPNLNGANVKMRSEDGIHFTKAGNEKVAFFVEKAVRQYYVRGALSVAVVDPLAGTAAGGLVRPPYLGENQGRLLEIAGAIVDLDQPVRDGGELVLSRGIAQRVFNLESLMEVPAGRADGFYPQKIEEPVPTEPLDQSGAGDQEISQLN